MTQFINEPQLSPSLSTQAPLAAILSFTTDFPVSGYVEIHDGKRIRHIGVPCDEEPGRQIIIAGMRPGYPNRIVLQLRDEAGAWLAPTEFAFAPPPVPASTVDFPPINLKIAHPENMEPGFIILSVRRRPANRAIWWTEKQNAFATRWSMLVAIDEDGQVVWYYQHNSRIAGVDRLENGNLFFNQVNFQSTEIDMLGTTHGSWYAAKRPFGPADGAVAIDAQSMHHQPHVLPNGNFLAMTANARRFDNYPGSETDPDAPRQSIDVVGDRIVEFDRKGNIVWSWNAFDHLDPFRIGYQTFEPYWDTRGFRNHADWTHGNGVCHDHRDNSIIISLRIQDALIKVDRASGEIKWILGPPTGWDADKQKKLLTPVGDFQWPWHGHNPRVTPEGTIVMYDNAILQARPFDPPKPPHECFSRALEFEVDEARMEVREVWSSYSEARNDSVLSWAMGDAHRLPLTGNMLVVDSFCYPKQDPIDKLGNISHADLAWDEWDRERWHMSDFSYWARIREMQRDPDKSIAFEAHVEDPFDIMGWEVFGAVKAPALGLHYDGPFRPES